MPAGSAVRDVTDATFATEVLTESTRRPVVVDFWAPWCGPCRVLGPVIERVAAEFGEGLVLAKLNTDENQKTAMAYGIQGIPAVKAFRNGEVVAEFTGAIPEQRVRAFFQQLVPGEADRAAAEASERLRQGDVQGAEERFRAALESQPANVDALVGLAAIPLSRGETSEAERLLDRAPGDRRAKALKHRIFLEGFAQRHAGEDLEGEAAIDPKDPRARYRWGVMLAAREQYERALDELIESVRLDRSFAEGAARKAALAVFDILGLDSPVTRDYQRRLSSILF
ncbi:MAG: thioredoxin [Thermoflexaceae bacterium]|nr:thioredoxin [Thermoflexaceae bacterium]